MSDDDFDDTPLTQARLPTQVESFATQVPRDVLLAASLDAPYKHDATSNGATMSDRTLQLLSNFKSNGETPAIAAGRLAQKRKNEQAHEANGVVKKHCVRLNESPNAEGVSGAGKLHESTTSQGRLSPAQSQQSAPEDLSIRAQRSLAILWPGDTSYGIPRRWRSENLDNTTAVMYVNLCQSIKDRGINLSCLWTEAPQYLERECRKQGGLNKTALMQTDDVLEHNAKAQNLLQNVTNLVDDPRHGPQEVEQRIPPRTLSSRTGRLVTGRQARCPVEQQQILDSSGIEYPPLPGSDVRPGSMPLKIFEHLTAEADSLSNLRAVPELAEDTSEPQHEETDAPAEEADDSQEVSGSQWPASPDRAAQRQEQTTKLQSSDSSSLSSAPASTPKRRRIRRNLPPNSSQLDGSKTSISKSSSPEVSVLLKAGGEDLDDALREPGAVEEDDASPEPGAKEDEEILQASHFTADQHETPDHVNGELPAIAESNDVDSHDSENEAQEQSTASEGKPIQVARTPFPGKPVERPELNAPESSFVPSTYLDHTKTTSHRAAIQASADMPRQNAAEPREDAPQSTPRDSNYRDQTGSDGSSDAAEYARRLEVTRTWRRTLLKPISKPIIAAATATLGSINNTAPVVTNQPHPFAATNGKTKVAAEIPKLPALTLSNQAPLQKNGQGPARAKSPLTQTTHTPDANSALYLQFITAYEDYKGTLKDFERGCRILAKYNATKKTHSYLQDDFVFHYTQSYDRYLTECHDSGDDPDSFATYFDPIEPTHLKKIIVSFQGGVLDQLLAPATTQKTHVDLTRSSSPLPWAQYASQQTGLDRVRNEEPSKEPERSNGHRRSEPDHVQQPAASQQSLDASQSVEEWLESTVPGRAPSPELGTLGIDRSTEDSPISDKANRASGSKRRVTISPDHQAKRPRLISSTFDGPDDMSGRRSTPARVRVSGGIASSSQSSAAAFKVPSLLPKSTPVRRSLPASFPTSAKRPPLSSSPPDPPRLDPALKGFISEPKQRTTARMPSDAAGPLNSGSSRVATTMQPPAPSAARSSLPSSSANGRRSVAERRSLNPEWCKDESTPFKRFAAGWMRR